MQPNANTLSVSSSPLLGIPENLRIVVVIGLLSSIAGVSPNAESLSVSASPLLGIPENLRWQVIIYLLFQIQQNGGTGGGGGGAAAIVGTFATPNGNVTGSTGQLYVDKNLQTLWVQENSASANTGWVQFV